MLVGFDGGRAIMLARTIVKSETCDARTRSDVRAWRALL